MEVVVLSNAEVRELLPVAECVDLMEQALIDLTNGDVWHPLRTVMRPPDEPSLMGLMAAHRSAPSPDYGIKVICIFPGNRARGLESHMGTVTLFDGETGAPLAIVDAGAVTAIRTAAVSAVATRALARADATRLAVLGAGIQARAHLQALAHVRPFESARIWGRTEALAKSVAEELDLPFPVDVAPSAREAIARADVVATTTASREPIVAREWFAPGAHINAVGSSIPTAREIDAATVADAALFVDRRESFFAEAGDYLLAVDEIGPREVRGELGEVLTGAAEGRRDAEELTLFKSLGLAAEDLAAVEHLYRRASETGSGQRVEL
ncbi:MAG TPA: ornithine cyclodeaminase family protein [Gaiellaceae bacterium]|nr:ornithine cyclodeaminase family protein [Gaiellaceae bacterium]